MGKNEFGNSITAKLSGLSRRYVTALRKQLKDRRRSNLQPALRLGRQAAALGLETLELARIHQRALAALESSGNRKGLARRAEIFFAAANTVIEETHPAARQHKMDMHRLNKTLKRRTAALAAANRQVQRGNLRRKHAEDAFQTGSGHYPRLLKESLKLQEGLRQMTRRNLSAQESERQRISRQLQDEIAQTLLSINVRLLNLRTAARGDQADLAKEIASTQRLVEESVKSISRFARELDLHQPA